MHYNARDLPFVLEFFTDFGEVHRVNQFWSRHQVPFTMNALTPIRENLSLGIRLYAKDGMGALEVRMLLETSIYDENGRPKPLEILPTSQDHRGYIYRPEDGIEFPWRMGVYFFEVQLGEQVYNSAISVLPIHLSQDQVQHIHGVLEEEIEGIIYDLVYTQMSTSQEHELLRNKAYYDYVLRLINQRDQLTASLMLLERRPLDAIKTAYSQGEYPQIQDQKSLRWNGIRGGHTEHNKQKVLSPDIPANRWMKHMLLSWKYELMTVGRAIGADLAHVQATVIRKEEEKRASEEHKRQYFHAHDISYESKNAMKFRISRLEDYIRKARKEIGVLSRWNDAVENMAGRLTYLLVATDFKDVPRGRQKPVLKAPHYRTICKWIEEGRKVLLGDQASKHIVRVLKPTWKIYEQFVYFQVVNMIQRCGFRMASSVLKEDMRQLESGSMLLMENEGWIIHAWYDRHVEMREDAARSGDPFYSRQVIQPDVRLDLYKKGPVPTFISCVAMDAKHRKYKSLYNEAYTNDVFTQLSKYQNINYSGENTTSRNKRRPVVDRVICVYSRDRNAHIIQEEQPLVYIQLFPELADGSIQGYPELLGELSAWLEENMEYN